MSTADGADRRALSIAEEPCALRRQRFASLPGAEEIRPVPSVVDGQPWVAAGVGGAEIGLAGETGTSLADDVVEIIDDFLIEQRWSDS